MSGGIFLYIKLKAQISWRKLLGIMLFRFGVGGGWGMMFIMIPITFLMHYMGQVVRMGLFLYIWWGILLGPGLFLFIIGIL